MYYSKNAPNQGVQKQNLYSQNKDILKGSSSFSLQGDILNIQNLHPTLKPLKYTVSGLGDSFNNYHLGKCLPAEQRTNDQQSDGVHSKARNSHSLDNRVKNPYAFKLSKPRKLREYAVKLNLPKTEKCGRYVTDRVDGVTIGKSVEGGMILKGLQSCSRKHCPVCQTKVAMQRERSLLLILNNAALAGYKFVFATYTFSHTLRDSIEFTKKRIKSLVSTLHRSPRFKRLFKLEELPSKVRSNQVLPETTIDYAGYIIRYEDRFSEKTGWHSHAHVIYLVKPKSSKLSDLELKKIENTLFTEYQAGAIRRGIKVHRNGFDCRLAEPKAISGYFTKTEIKISKEFTDIFNKNSESKSLFQLIEYWTELQTTDSKKADSIKKRIFVLSKAITKQKDFIISEGVKNFAHSPEANKILCEDKEIVEQEKPTTETICFIPSPIWWQVRKLGLINYLPKVAEKKGIEGVAEFLCENGLLVCHDAKSKTIELLE